MKLNNLINQINEARGKGSFDYFFWFWAKKGSAYGLGYARQNIKLDFKDPDTPAGEGDSEFEKTLHPTVKRALDALEKIKQVKKATKTVEGEKDLEIVEKKINVNTKRIQGIADLFSSPIIIHWLTGDEPAIVTIPHYQDGDVTDSNGRQIKVLEFFRDPEIRKFVTHDLDWDKVNINDKKGNTLNTIISRFIQVVFASGGESARKKARSVGLEQMKDLKFKSGNVEVVSFRSTDYNILPKALLGSKKIIGKLKELIEKDFKKLFDKARSAF